MDPLNFISLAARLASSEHEADRRTAVSRAYYGAFHVARRFLATCGLRFTQREAYAAEVHRKVQYCLDQCGTVEALRASSNLRSLRERRNDADYDLESNDFDGAATVLALVKTAIETTDFLRHCEHGPMADQIRARVREYARGVLRMMVVDD